MNKSTIVFMTLFLVSFKVTAAVELKVGDVLLQPLKCWACSLIEAEEDSIYSHVGVIVKIKPEVEVAEAFSNVKRVSLKEFNAKTEPGQKISIRRFKNQKITAELSENSQEFLEVFDTQFAGRKYDHDFRWNNFDENGEEKLYCSEMISKLFQSFMGVEIPVYRMHFNQNREQWITYFRGNPPDHEWGNSPATFERSELFYEVGEL